VSRTIAARLNAAEDECGEDVGGDARIQARPRRAPRAPRGAAARPLRCDAQNVLV